MQRFLLMAGLLAFVGGTAVTTTGCSKEQRAKAKDKMKTAGAKMKAAAKKAGASMKAGAKKAAASAKRLGKKAAAGAKKLGTKAKIAAAGIAATAVAATSKKKWLCKCQVYKDGDGSHTGTWEGRVSARTRLGAEKGTAANSACEEATAQETVDCKKCSCRPDTGTAPEGLKKAG